MALSSDGISAGPPELDSLRVGTELDGRFRLTRKLGRGGMGQVYEAIDVRLGRRVAVKLLRSTHGALTQLKKRFEREARAVAQVQHENVVTVFDFGVAPNQEPFLVMEYLEGNDLRALLNNQGQLTAPRAARLMHDACLGLAAAHARGVIHRDLKPENLFAVQRGLRLEACKVLDFGLAKLLVPDGSDLQTRAGVPFGTLHYMSPEQARGEPNLDERTDVYSAAAVLYELLSGHRPHAADSAHALLYKITHEAPQRLEERADFVPPGLADVVHRALAADRAARPASMEAFAALLERFAAVGHAKMHTLQIPEQALAEAPDTQPDIVTEAKTREHPTHRTVVRRSRALAAIGVAVAGCLWLLQRGPAAGADPRPLGGAVAAARPSVPSAEAPSDRRQAQTIPPTTASRSDETITSPTVAAKRQPRLVKPTPSATPATGLAPSTAPQAKRSFDRQNPYEDASATSP